MMKPENELIELRKRAEEDLRKSEERFRALVEASSEVLYRMSPDWKDMRHLQSRRFLANTEKPSNTWLQEYIPPNDQPYVISAINEAIRTKSIFELEHRVQRADGTLGWTFSRAVPLVDANGEIVEWFGAASDITERRQAEEALKDSEARLRAIFEAAEEAIITLDEEQCCLGANPAAGTITGVPHDLLVGRYLREFVDPAFDLASAWKGFIESRRFRGEVPIRHVSGSLCIVEVYATANIGHGRHLFIAHDITERKRMEVEIRKSRDELEVRVLERTSELLKEIEKRTRFAEILKESGRKLALNYMKRKNLAQRLVEMIENDRREIAMTLHDHVGSILTGAKIEIERVEAQLAESPVAEGIAKVKGLVTETINMIRNISSQLRPSSLDRFGLAPSLRSLTDEAARNIGIRIHLHMSGMPKRFSPDKELALYRIAQESLNNIAKYAEAKTVFVTLGCRDGTIHLTIEDDGKGFDLAELDNDLFEQEHLGMSIMKERALRFAGSFRLESHPGKGTQIMVEIPF